MTWASRRTTPGQFIGLSHFAGQLQAALKDMSAEQRNAALTTMFASDAVRAAAVLYDEGAAGSLSGPLTSMTPPSLPSRAAALTDNLRGDLERLGRAFDTALIQSGSAANDALRAWCRAWRAQSRSSRPCPHRCRRPRGWCAHVRDAAAGRRDGCTAAQGDGGVGVLGRSTASSPRRLPQSPRRSPDLGVVGAAAAALTVAGSAMESVWLDSMGASDDAAKSLDAYLTKGRESRTSRR